MARIWIWLKNKTNREVLGFIGAGFAAVVVAAWKLFNHFEPAIGDGDPSGEPSFPIEVVGLEIVSCSRRGGRDALCKVGDTIHTPPVKNGVGTAVFVIPDGASRIAGVVGNYDAKNCAGRGSWSGEISVDGRSLLTVEMTGDNSIRVSEELPEGSDRVLELIASDLDNDELCDDPDWILTIYK